MKILIFSGTSEGRKLTEFLNSRKIPADVCVATDFGRSVMKDMPFITVHAGRLNAEEMVKLAANFDIVVDATHPYAEEVSSNIRKACGILKKECIRLLRDEGKAGEKAVEAENVEAAAELLKNTEGNIFVSTGSKELEKYCRIENFGERLAVRVLPSEEVRSKCKKLGIKNVLYKKGPFGYEENISDFKRFDVRWLVTKSSGRAGGFDEKIRAAEYLNINVIVIKRPYERGFSPAEVEKIIEERVGSI